MLDPFQTQYGNVVTLMIYLATLMGDLLWTASILKALGQLLKSIQSLYLTLELC